VSKWEMFSLKDVCSLITDGTHQTPQYAENGYMFLSSKNVKSGKIDWDEIKYIPEELHYQLYNRIAPQLGDVLLAKNGTTGVAAVVDRDCVFDIYVSLALLRPKGVILSEYLLYAINNPITKRKFNRELKGIGVPNLHLQNIRETTIPVPPLETQKQIAITIDTAIELLTMRKQQLTEMDNLIKSTFNDMFGVFATDKNCYKLLPKICNFIDYRGKTPEKSDCGIPLITAKNVKNNSFSIEPQEYIPAYTYEAVMTRGFPKINDVIFTTEAPLGNVCRIPDVFDKFAVGQRIIVMQPLENMVTPEYLEFALTSDEFQRDMFKRSSGSTVIGIRSKELVQLAIPVPPFILQTQFAEIVTKIEEQKALVKKAIDETQSLFDSLMSEYFE